MLLNNAGASIDVTVNKNAAANDASFSFKTGFSVRALFGILGSDDFTLKASPDGSAFFDALVADRATGRVRFPVGLALSGLVADPGSPADGWLWHNGAIGQLKARLNGLTRIIDAGNIPFNAPLTGDFVATTMGSGSATGTLAGAADRVDRFPFIPRGDLTIDRLAVNVTAAVAAALGKIVVYAADEAGRPTTLLLETATLDFSIVAAPAATVSLTLRKGVTYWFGIRHRHTVGLARNRDARSDRQQHQRATPQTAAPHRHLCHRRAIVLVLRIDRSDGGGGRHRQRHLAAFDLMSAHPSLKEPHHK